MLGEAVLGEAVLREAVLREAVLREAVLREAVLRETVGVGRGATELPTSSRNPPPRSPILYEESSNRKLRSSVSELIVTILRLV